MARAKTKWTGRRHRFLAVDFDDRELRIALMDRGTTLKLRRAVRAAFPENVSPSDPETFGAFLAETLKTHKLGIHPVLLAVPRSQCVIKPLQLPANTAADEAPAMVQFQTAGDLPFPFEESVLDFAVQGRDEEGLWILAAAMHVQTVEQYRRGLIQAGLKPLRLGFRATATARAIEACGLIGADQTVVSVFITHDETEVSVFFGERVLFSRAAGVAVPSGDGAAEDTDAIVSEIIRSLQGFQAMHHEQTVSAIYIAGATGREAEVADMLSQLHGIACRRVDPYEFIKLRAIEDDGSAFMAAIGLSIGAGAEKWPIDFFNPKKPVVRRSTKEVRRNVIAMAGALIALILAGASWIWLDSLETEVDSLVLAKKKQLETKEGLEKLMKRVGAMDKWADENGNYLVHLAELSVLMPGADQCYIKEIKTSPDTMDFVVYSRRLDVVDEFMKTLEKAGYSPKTGNDGPNQQKNSFGYMRETNVTVSFPKKLPVPIDQLESQTTSRPADDDLNKSLIQRPKKKRNWGRR